MTIDWRKGSYKVELSVVKANKQFGLLGCDLLDQETRTCFSTTATDKKLPVVSGVTASIKLLPDAKPFVAPARKVPLPLEQKINDTIDELLAMGVLEPVDAGGVTNASPVVWVKKKNGKLRMCADYKVHVNNKIQTEAYLIPSIETIFQKISGAKCFAKIDLSNAYWQIALDAESQHICVVNTTRGMFKITRLQPGIKNAAAIFQKTSSKV